MILAHIKQKPNIQYLQKLEYGENVHYCNFMVSHANQLINSKHLQRFPEPSKSSLSLVH